MSMWPYDMFGVRIPVRERKAPTLPRYPWPDPTSVRIKQLEEELAAKDAEIARLREGWLEAECGKRQAETNAWSEACFPVCQYAREGGDCCEAVRKAVEA